MCTAFIPSFSINMSTMHACYSFFFNSLSRQSDTHDAIVLFGISPACWKVALFDKHSPQGKSRPLMGVINKKTKLNQFVALLDSHIKLSILTRCLCFILRVLDFTCSSSSSYSSPQWGSSSGSSTPLPAAVVAS